jgi:hypothetical protein
LLAGIGLFKVFYIDVSKYRCDQFTQFLLESFTWAYGKFLIVKYLKIEKISLSQIPVGIYLYRIATAEKVCKTGKVFVK